MSNPHLQPGVFSGKTVLVTGPAGNLGSAVIDKFHSGAASLILLDRHPDRLAERYPQLAASAGHLILPNVDLLVYTQVEGAVDQAVQKLGGIDCLVHTAGGFQMGEMVHEITPESWSYLMDLNVTTFLNITRAVVPHMLRRQAGKIVTVAARPALSGKARMGAYSAAKASLLRLTESLSAELKSHGISANCILPGTIDTPENRQAMPDADTSRWVSPHSLAEVIYFLCSPAAGDIQGAAIPVYGE